MCLRVYPAEIKCYKVQNRIESCNNLALPSVVKPRPQSLTSVAFDNLPAISVVRPQSQSLTSLAFDNLAAISVVRPRSLTSCPFHDFAIIGVIMASNSIIRACGKN